ncbi:DNA replication/repair protein RecF [Dehalococcoidia bacterium]|nr:DNA replication/repair protein RecF [Dehalococcoidia bacterium]
MVKSSPYCKEGSAIYFSRLKLSNFRNYESLDLELEPGTIILRGDNGQGKSNLIEALYLLAIAKSPRASTDGEMVRSHGSIETHTQIAGVIVRDNDEVHVQVDLVADIVASSDTAQTAPIKKQIRVNGISRRAPDLIGEITAVMFSAQDLNIVFGSPAFRRKYLNILISQIDARYLRELNTYQHVLHQRNQLLKSARIGHSSPSELDYWDSQLVATGQYILQRRMETVSKLITMCDPIHKSLTTEEKIMDLIYVPSVNRNTQDSTLKDTFRATIEGRRAQDIAAGFTTAGPHRDDLQIQLDGLDLNAYASRGQCRSIVLAMRLGEARYLSESRMQEPILLLDDVLSELDEMRRAKVLEYLRGYQQCFVTTSDLGAIESRFMADMSIFTIRDGHVAPSETVFRD